jgi:signal peptidase I
VSSSRVEYNFEKRHRLVREIIETVVLTVLMFVIINLAVQNYDVTGPSMESSLHNQERIMVDKLSYLFHSPERGDVIVFVAPPAPTENYVKRIIGVPGDVITVNGTVVTLDGTTLNETYVNPTLQGNPNPPITNCVVPDNQYFVMGDDRKNSSDSRVWGFVPRNRIIGRAALVYWPLGQDNNGFLPNVSSVFANVHQPTNQAALAQSPPSKCPSSSSYS